ncbi:SGNH/GDSL hydrolase family protein [Aurantimonas litoralis]|nr:SGNH/GDSL hydrolase family protein [Aurantimonas litoralis]
MFLVPTAAATRPSYGTVSAVASYTQGDFSMAGAGTSGTKTFTRSGGHPSADAGTGTWYAVVEYDDGSREFNVVVSGAGDVFTLAHSLTGAAVGLHNAHSAATGQHLSTEGSKALAQYLWGQTRKRAFRETSEFSLWHGDKFLYNSDSLYTPQTWNPYGGLALNAINFASTANASTSTPKFIHSNSTICVNVNTDAAGEGVSLDIATGGKHLMLAFSCGINDSTLAAAGSVTVLRDGVSIYTKAFNTFLSWHEVEISEGSTDIEIRVTRTTAGTTAYSLRIGEVHAADLTDLAAGDDPLIGADDKVLLIGDSWFDDGDAYGAPFDTEIRALMTAAGGAGTITNEAIGGSKISDWSASLAGWLTTYQPTKVVLHTGINEQNSGVTATTLWQQIRAVLEQIRASGADAVYLMQGCISSESLSQELFKKMAMQDVADYDDRYPALNAEWLTTATTAELGNATTLVNLRSKGDAGRQVTRVNDSVVVAPNGPLPADGWTAV